MTKVTFLPHEEICPEGKTIDADPGITLCDLALANGIELEHACEKSCACTTCHVIVREGFNSLDDAEDNEEDMLDKAWDWSRNRAWRARQRLPMPTWSWRYPNTLLIWCPKTINVDIDVLTTR
jgi:2Fe-2S type ferredoxin (ISC system)